MDGVARASRTLRAATSPDPGDRVVQLLVQMIGLRFTATVPAANAERPGGGCIQTGRGALLGRATAERGAVPHLPVDDVHLPISAPAFRVYRPHGGKVSVIPGWPGLVRAAQAAVRSAQETDRRR